MRKIVFLLVLTVVFGLNIAAVSAYSEDEFSSIQTRQAGGLYTVITDIEGEEHRIDGVIDAKIIESGGWAESIASYEICSGKETILCTELNDIVSKDRIQTFANRGEPFVNGYYSTRFTLSEEDHTEVFLTGLSDEKIDKVQEALIGAKIENSQFSIEDLDFIDAEKTDKPNDGDDMLCWAAACANTLHYTGWGQRADAKFSSPDDIFDDFINAFDDNGSQPLCGYNWFFNGINDAQEFPGWAQVKEYGKSGMYLKEYSSWKNMKSFDVAQDHEKMIPAVRALEQGCRISISLGWVDEYGNRNGGHAITLWGYIIDKDFKETDSERYKALIVSDSDVDMLPEGDRREAPNKLSVLNMIPYRTDAYDTWKFEGYFGFNWGTLELLTSIVPYSDEIEKETDETASRNAFENFDFLIYTAYLSSDPLDDNVESKSFVQGETLYITPEIQNASEQPFNPPDGSSGAAELGYTVSIFREGEQGNSPIFSETCTYDGEIPELNASALAETKKSEIKLDEKFTPGKYILKIEVNPKTSDGSSNSDGSRKIEEAYYYNNTYTGEFSVVEDSVDLSDVKITAQIGEAKDGEAEAELSYSGMDAVQEILDEKDTKVTLMYSYLIDEKWSRWENAPADDTPAVGVRSSGSVLPEKCTIYANGPKVKFRLRIEPADRAVPVINIYSEELNFEYVKFKLEEGHSHAEECTPVDYGATQLNKGEQIALKVKNISSFKSDESLSCDIMLYAVRNASDGAEQRVELARYQNVAVGGAIGAESTELIFTEWSQEAAEQLSGTYTVVASLRNEYYSAEFEVSELTVREKAGLLKVTTADDIVDEGDGETSLREAIANAENFKGSDEGSESEPVITFAEGITEICLNEQNGPLIIDSKMTIDGSIQGSESKAVILYGDEKAQLFSVEEEGDLSLKTMILRSGFSENGGGAVRNNGGKVRIENSRIIYNKSGGKGGGIYSSGGSVVLKNCSFKGNTSAAEGGAAAADQGAEIQMLNCNLFQNDSGGGTVYNSGGHISIIHSTITDNYSSQQEGAGVLCKDGTIDLFGSIAGYNDFPNISGNVELYGSYIEPYSSSEDQIKKDEYTVSGSVLRLLRLNEYGNTIWDPADSEGLVSYKTKLSSEIEKGILVRNAEDGKIKYSNDGENWKSTDIVSVFTDEEYSRDIFGKKHEGLFGSDSEVCEDIALVRVGEKDLYDENLVYIYASSPQKAILMETRTTGDSGNPEVFFYDVQAGPGMTMTETAEYDGTSERGFLLLPDHLPGDACVSEDERLVHRYAAEQSKVIYERLNGEQRQKLAETAPGAAEMLTEQYDAVMDTYDIKPSSGGVEVIGLLNALPATAYESAYISAEQKEPADGAGREALSRAAEAAEKADPSANRIACYDIKLMVQAEGESEAKPADISNPVRMKIRLSSDVKTDTLQIYWIVADENAKTGSESGTEPQLTKIENIEIISENSVNYAVFDTEALGYFVLYAQKKTSGGGESPVSHYTVTFDTRGGSKIDSLQVKKGGKAVMPENPVREGYIFAGWFTDEECTKVYDFDTAVAGNLTLYGKWTKEGEEPENPFRWDNPFADVSESHWFYSAVGYVCENKLFSGVSDTQFAPNHPMTRAMLVTVRYRAEGEPEIGKQHLENPFADTDAESWYGAAVYWARGKGLVNGYSDELFAPEKFISRQEMAAILARYADFKDLPAGSPADLTRFSDAASVAGWAEADMQWAVGAGILSGKGDGRLDPLGSATRGETAAMLQRFLEK